MSHTDNGLPQIHQAQFGFMKEMLATILVGFCLFYATPAGAAISKSNRPDVNTNTVSDQTNTSNNLSVLCFSMTTGMIVAVVFIGILILINRGGAIIEKLSDFIEYMNKRKHIHRNRVPAVIAKRRKTRVVKTLTDEQIPQVKKQIEEICILINRHIETIRQLRDAAVTRARSSGVTTGRMQYKKKYARQLNMINAAVPRLITEADRISAVDEEYKQQIHDWILAMRKSLEDCDPKHIEQMVRVDNAHSQKPSINETQSSL
ncbi:hypothetical protein ACFL3F_04900 [Planctomycetota bacterium]